ncbi:MAG TPA: DNA-processing protein DprA [Dissulfurispiraceae bacterium]|nr:DNA-processing protein DprA [Dissulfurispiraceae bacterium]
MTGVTPPLPDTQDRTESLKFWLALSSIREIGPITIKKLLAKFHTPRNIMAASKKELMQVSDVKESRAQAIREFNAWHQVEQEIDKIAGLGIRVVTLEDTDYPVALRQIDDSPALFYIKGQMREEDSFAIGIVGSRNMTPYGRKVADIFSSELALKGFTIVSGMAKGIDSSAHKGALRVKGRSIAVLGCGVDKPYPPENSGLLEELSQCGAVISEFPLGTAPLRENFPRRNRLISGLSLGVLIVEAAAGSGSLITANYALEQGKDIFAVPGNITSMNSIGTNDIIKKGAKLVQKVDDIIVELAPLLKGMMNKSEQKTNTELLTNLNALEINDEERAICSVLGSETRHIDIISRETGIAAQKTSAHLLALELRGIVRQTEGKRYYMV